MKEADRIFKIFEKDKSKLFTPKELAKMTGIKPNKIQNILKTLLSEDNIERVSRGKYSFTKPKAQLSKEHLKRYITTLEKTCEIAIHELMLTEPLVGKEDLAEIEHQIAFFARHLIKARWALDKDTSGSVDIDEEVFSRARKIHDWSKFVFEDSFSNKK
jgi:predicted transcriptional regulator